MSKIIHSVSIVPHYKSGYLLCEEMRKKLFPKGEKELKKHLIGGKVEEGEFPLPAACREFCEEVPLDYDYKKMTDEIDSIDLYYTDFLVNSKKHLYNRFFTFEVDDIIDPVLKNLLIGIVEKFNPVKSELISLFYWDGKEKLKNTSTQLDAFISHGPRIEDEISLDKLTIRDEKIEEENEDKEENEVFNTYLKHLEYYTYTPSSNIANYIINGHVVVNGVILEPLIGAIEDLNIKYLETDNLHFIKENELCKKLCKDDIQELQVNINEKLNEEDNLELHVEKEIKPYKCQYKLVRGKRRGQLCGNGINEGFIFCRSHITTP